MPLVAVFVLLGWILAVALHEFGHALVAYWGGDHTVKDRGYLTMNPLRYTDPIMSIVLPVVFLLMGGIGLPGGAVYIQTNLLRSRWWETTVSLAGPFMSAVAALLFALPFVLGLVPRDLSSFLWNPLAFLVQVQIFSVFLNLIPVPPLDGFGVISAWLSRENQIRVRSFSMYGLLAMFLLLTRVPGVAGTLWNMVDAVMNILGVPHEMAYQGYRMFKFWEYR